MVHSLNWKKPSLNTFCVSHYIIYWDHTENRSNDSSTVSNEDNFFVIEHLGACVEYEVSVRAVNEKNGGKVSVTYSTRTGTAGN